MGYWYKLVNGVRKYIVDKNGKLINCDHCPCKPGGDGCELSVFANHGCVTSIAGVSVSVPGAFMTVLIPRECAESVPSSISLEINFSNHSGGTICITGTLRQKGTDTTLGTYDGCKEIDAGSGSATITLVNMDETLTGIETV